MSLRSLVLTYPGGADLSFGYAAEDLPEYVRLHTTNAAGGGNMEVQLPMIEGDIGDGACIIICNAGTQHDVLLNPFAEEHIEGQLTTLRIGPGQSRRYLGGAFDAGGQTGRFGWVELP